MNTEYRDAYSSLYGRNETLDADDAKALARFADLSRTHMARLALYPGTNDADRYARAVRHVVNASLNFFGLMMHTPKTSAVVPIVLSGVLREVKHNRPVADNARTLETALDLLAETCPEITWR